MLIRTQNRCLNQRGAYLHDKLTCIHDFLIISTTAASIGFDRLEYDVIENARFANVTIRLTGSISKDIVVLVSTADGSAVCKSTTHFCASDYVDRYVGMYERD